MYILNFINETKVYINQKNKSVSFAGNKYLKLKKQKKRKKSKNACLI